MEVMIAGSILQYRFQLDGTSYVRREVVSPFIGDAAVANFDVAEQARTYRRHSHNMYVKPISPAVLLTCIFSANTPLFLVKPQEILHLHVAGGISP
jgi:hypothetical protein